MWAIETHATIDWETYSEAGVVWNEDGQKWEALRGAGNKKSIGAVGAAAYAEHPTTDILTLSYKLPGWTAVRRWRPGLPIPQDLFDHIAAGGLVEAHNVMFERLIWLHVAQRLYGFPPLPAAQLRCSMAKARVNNLPGALDNLTAVLPTHVKKNPDGKRLIQKFAGPRKPTKKDPRLRIRPEEDPEDGEKLYLYCDDDVYAEEEASALTMPMSVAELQFWQVDQDINWRGIGVDRAGVRDMIAVMEHAQEKYGAEFAVITGGLSPAQVSETVKWLAGRGVPMSNLDGDAIDEALARTNLPADARRVLEIRALVGSASVKKLYALDRTCSADNRVRNIIIHHGARTGRPTGDLVQPLNLPKAGPDLIWCASCDCPSKPGPVCPWCRQVQPPDAKKYKWPDVPKHMDGTLPIDWVMPVMATRSLDEVERFFGDALLTISGCVRGMFQAGPGMDLISSDYSAIEAVVTAALAGCEWRLETFRRKEDIYLMSAAQRRGGLTYEGYLAYKEENGTHHWHRQKWGKVFELACLGPKTQVLTDAGYLDIVDVTTNHKVWDGFEWVRHEGLAKRGTKTVLNLDGLWITPDHLVSLKGSWLAANNLVSDDRLLTQALENGSEALKRLVALNDEATGNTSLRFNAIAALTRIGSRCITSVMGNPRGAILALKKLLPATAKNIFAMQMRCQMMNIGAGYSTGYLPQSLGATTRNPEVLETTVAEVSKFAMSGGVIKPSFYAMFKPCRAGISRLLKWIEEIRTAITSPEISGSSPERITPATNEKSKTCKPSSTTTSCVYDLVNAGPRHRFTVKTDNGHMVVHNCGFGGWLGAVRAFDTETPDEEVKEGILAWRDASPEIVEMWGGQARGKPWMPDYRLERFGFEGAFVNAVQFPTASFTSHGITFYMRGDALIIRLLSGRELTYHNPRLHASDRGAGLLEITYNTWNSNPKYGPIGWGPMKTYAGRIAENIVQATAHDIQRFGILAQIAAGYPTVLHVYDENVSEVPEGFGSVEEFEAIMSTMPPWATGWPIRASGGWRGKRYRKA